MGVSLAATIGPCFIAALILTSSRSMIEVMWTFSEYLEGFAMVPQYVFSYRENAPTLQKGPLMFIMLFGTYRCFYALNWMYKIAFLEGYRDPQSWLGGLFEILFYFDFLSFQYQQKSVLRALVLKIDDSVNETVENMELKILPSRAEAITAKKTELSEMRQRRVLGANYE